MQEILLNPKYRIRISYMSVAGIVFFYSVFQPFQMSRYNMNDYIFVNVAYLILSGIVISFHLVFFPKYFNDKFVKFISLRRGRQLYLIWIIFVLGVSFFVFKISFGYYNFTPERIMTGLLSVAALTVFPLLVLSIADRETEETKEPEEPIIHTSAGEINLDEILYVYSDKNYVVWVDLSGNEIKMRGTLKSICDQLQKNSGFVQTHRAFLVNSSKVNDIVKENNAYTVRLKEYDKRIPLSRGFYSSLRTALYP